MLVCLQTAYEYFDDGTTELSGCFRPCGQQNPKEFLVGFLQKDFVYCWAKHIHPKPSDRSLVKEKRQEP